LNHWVQQEYSLIGRAEWIKLVGAFFNQELSASRYYNKVRTALVATSAAPRPRSVLSAT
jgi:hypothetical protein